MAHAVQPLKLKFPLPGQGQYHAGGVGIVGGKLGEYLALGIQQ